MLSLVAAGELLFVLVHGLLVMASLVVEYRLQSLKLQRFCFLGLFAPRHVGLSPTKD